MKKLVLSWVWLVCCALSGFTQETPFVDGDLLVMLEPGVEPSLVTDEARIVDGKQTFIYLAETPSKLGRIYLYHFDHTIMDQYKMLNFVKRIVGVEEAQFNHYVQDRRAVPTDPDFGSQWHHIDASDNDIDSDLAWNTTTGGSTANGFDIVACVVEQGGMTWGHSDLVGNHWTNSGEIANNGIDDDGNGRIDDFDGWNTPAGNDNIANAAHGTGVMGMIGAVANNANGGVGVNWNVDLMPVVVGSLTEANVVAAYDYALDMRTTFNATNGAAGAFVVVVNSSWGLDNANPALYPVWCGFYNTMGAAGILNCAATTNNNANVDVVGDMPTGCSSQYLIAATATNSNDVRTFSGYGPVNVDIGAPGEAVWLPNSTGYTSWNGTSFASPCVAGAVALLYSAPCADLGADAIANPGGTALLVKNAIFNTVDQTAQLLAETSTGGRLNVNAALNELISLCGTAPGCAQLTMFDSFGDSWNGAVYNVYDTNGNLVASGTHAGGSSSVADICPGDGCYTLTVTGGSFPAEVSWSLSGVNEGTLSGGANATVSFSIGGLIYGCTDAAACNYNSSANCNDGSCCYNNCVTINMTDVFGDSWNGGTYSITDTFGTVVASGTHAGGPSSSNFLCLASGCYSITVTGGSFPSEIGWSLSGVNGVVSGGAPATVAFTIGTVIEGCMDPSACNYNPQANCSDASCVSCPNFCLSLTMTDSFGDGWNGATYTVTNGFGVVVLTGTLNSFYDDIQVDALCLDAGCYTLSVTNGTFPSEIGWTLNGANEGSLNGGAGTSVSFTVGTIINGCTDLFACNYNALANCSEGCVYCPESCVSITMTDSFGDGWNGGQYEIYDVFGNLVLTGTMDGGNSDVDVNAICLPDGCYTMNVTGGTFPAEIGWTLNGANEGALSGGAPVSGISFSVGFAPVYGCTDPFACNFNANATCSEGCVYCPGSCVRITMTDSFGDGWNGGQYEIYDVFGNLVLSGTMDGGNWDVDVNAICLPDGCYTMNVTGGTFPSEIGWTLNGANEGALSGGAPVSGISFSIGFSPVYGCTDPFACNYNANATCSEGCVYCPESCLSITMTDSFGDGWDSGAYSIYNVFGVLVATGTMDGGNGSLDVNAICLPDGCYTMEVTGGFFSSEIGWTLNGANEGALSGGAPVSGISFSVGFAPVYGCTDPFACNYNANATCSEGCVYCPESCLSITMTDSFGDGWNGGQYEIYDVFGNLVLTGTMDGGNWDVDVNAICLPDGCYTMNVTGGTFPSEIGWTLNGANEGPLSGGAPSSGISFSVGFVPVYGCTDPSACNYNPAATCSEACVYCPENCLSITMTDSFGDGWDTGSYTIYNSSGVAVAAGTMDGGNGSIDVNAICLPAGCYTMDVTGGFFPSEIGWTLNGTNGGPISGGAPVSGISFSIGMEIPGCTDPFACNYNPVANCNDGTCAVCLNNCVSITMTDGFGDGWNGGQYTVTDNNGNVVAVGAMDSGDGSVDINALCLNDGCYVLSVSGGTFPSEIGWTLNGANESPISGGAPASGINFSVGTAVYGCTNCEAPNFDPAATCDDGSCLITCTGDFNGDNLIGTSDLLLFLGTFGSTPGPCSQTDLTDDGIVGLADLLLFLGVFGTTCP